MSHQTPLLAAALLSRAEMYQVDWAAIRKSANQPAATAPETAVRGHRWLPQVHPVVWSLGFTSLLTDISSEMVSSILPIYLLLHLHVSPAVFGIIDGLYQGVALLVRAAAGILGDRWRRHKAIAVTGYAVSAVCRLAMLAAGSAWTGIAAVVALDRTAKGLRTAPRDALISLATPTAELGRAFGVHRALDAAGAMLGPLIAFAILMAIPLGFDVIFVVSFCVAVLGLLVIVMFVRDADERRAAPRQLAPARTLALLAHPGLRRVALAAGLLSLCTVSDSFLFIAMQRQVGFAAGAFPLLFVAVGLVNFAFSTPAGYAADRFGRIRMFFAGHALLWCAYATLLIPGNDMLRVALSVLLIGAYYAATDGVLAAIAAAVLPRELCGTGLSLVSTITNLGRLLSSVLFGFAWTSWGLEGALTSFVVALAATLIASLFVLGRWGTRMTTNAA
jgi:MFS family permease